MNKVERFKDEIRKHIINKNVKKGFKEVKKIEKYLDQKNLNDDIVINLLRLCCNFFDAFNLVDKHIKTLTNLANFYLEFGAMQSAYRAIEEASEIARDNNKLKEFIDLHKLLLVACYQDKDLNGALDCYEIIKGLSHNIDADIMVNVGTVYLQKDKIDDAIEIFEKYLDYHNSSIRFNCEVNLAICYRKKGDINKSIMILDAIDHSNIFDKDYLIEYELVYAKSLIENNNFYEAIKKLQNSVGIIEQKIESVVKLYYRRGIREKYVPRLENLILSIPQENMNDTLLYILSFTRSNQTSDWLHILEWCDDIYRNKKVSSKDILNLEESIKYVADNGAPFLYGMLEKYDDHHDKHNTWRWDNLSNLINIIAKKYSIAPPLSKSCTIDTYNLLINKLSTSSLIFSFLSIDTKLMLVNKGKFEVVSLDEKTFEDYISLIYRYKVGDVSNKTFGREVERVQSLILNLISGFLIDSDRLNKKSLIYFPDRYGYFPIVSTVVKNESLKLKMIKEQYSIKTVPVLFPKGNNMTLNKESKIFGVYDEQSLELSKCEIENLKKNLNGDALSLIEQSDQNGFEAEMPYADILHVTTHGFPLDFYTDPCRASLEHSHVINTNNIQSMFYNLNYSLVLLHSCHSSSSINRRQINLTNPNSELNSVKSYDTFSLPAILLMNRKSSNISSSWKTFDKFSYILTHNISKNLAVNNDIEKSFSRAIAEMTSVNEESIENMLDNSIEEQAVMLKNKKSIVQMLKHPYSYATYQYYSLL